MPCQVTFILDKGKITTKVEWDNNKHNILDLRSFLGDLQVGTHNKQIIKAIVRHAKKTGDKVIAKRMIEHLANVDTILDEPVMLPEEVGQQLNSEE